MRTWARANRRKLPRCPACGESVRPHQPEVVITDVVSGRRRTYHAARTCMEAVSEAMLEPGTVHHFAVRTPNGDMN
jgi:hypothetical protein